MVVGAIVEYCLGLVGSEIAGVQHLHIRAISTKLWVERVAGNHGMGWFRGTSNRR